MMDMRQMDALVSRITGSSNGTNGSLYRLVGVGRRGKQYVHAVEDVRTERYFEIEADEALTTREAIERAYAMV